MGLFEIGKRKREFLCPEAKFKLRLITLHTCTCEVILRLYRNKLDIAQRGEGVRGGESVSGRSVPPLWSPEAEPLPGGFSAARHDTIKCNFTAAPRAGKERFLCLFQIKYFFIDISFTNIINTMIHFISII